MRPRQVQDWPPVISSVMSVCIGSHIMSFKKSMNHSNFSGRHDAEMQHVFHKRDPLVTDR